MLFVVLGYGVTWSSVFWPLASAQTKPQKHLSVYDNTNQASQTAQTSRKTAYKKKLDYIMCI